MRRVRWPLTLLLLLLPLLLHGVTADESTLQRLDVTLTAVERAVAFMRDASQRANIDGGIGVRSVEGQLSGLLSRYWTHLPVPLVSRLRRLQETAGEVADSVEESTRLQTPDYFRNAGQMLKRHFWEIFYPTRPLPGNVESTGKVARPPADFNEKFSDDCIREFYGRRGSGVCEVSRVCWNTMVLTRNGNGYFLTHQLFYLLNGIQANCLENLTLLATATVGGSHPLRGLFDRFCGAVLLEAEALAEEGPPAGMRDLFMEQIGICAMSGYREFARWRWWRLVIGWQRASGCYGAFDDETVNAENFNPNHYGNHRRKRSEQLMTRNGCLSHRTSVALDALMAFVRRSVEEAATANW